MISKLSSSISEKLHYANVISEEEQELYTYGFFLLISRCMFLFIAGVFGTIMGTFCESVFFYILFSVLRGYAGGIHASSEPVCMFFTTMLLLLASACFCVMKISDCVAVAVWMLLVGSIVVFLLSPLDSVEKPLNSSDRRYYRRISRLITVAMVFAGSVAIILKVYSVLHIVSICVTFEGFLLLIGKCKATHITRSTE